jgi:hypothetical protein
MKKLILSISLLFLLFVGCSTSKQINNNSTTKKLTNKIFPVKLMNGEWSYAYLFPKNEISGWEIARPYLLSDAKSDFMDGKVFVFNVKNDSIGNYIPKLYFGFDDKYKKFEKENKWGVFDRESSVVLEPQFDEILEIYENINNHNYIKFRNREKEGFYDLDNKVILIHPRYDKIITSYDLLEHNIIGIIDNDKFGYVNFQGEWVWGPY